MSAIGRIDPHTGHYALNGVPQPLGNGAHTVEWDEIKMTDFTDGGATAGTVTLYPPLPAGCIVEGWIANAYGSGWDGDTSATLLVGASADTDRFNSNVNPDLAAGGIFAGSGNDVGTGVGDGVAIVLAATNVFLTLTGTADFTTLYTAATAKLALTVFFKYSPSVVRAIDVGDA